MSVHNVTIEYGIHSPNKVGAWQVHIIHHIHSQKSWLWKNVTTHTKAQYGSLLRKSEKTLVFLSVYTTVCMEADAMP